ncbi:MAG TPA: serine/threonine-protein kinase [Polyangiaceae bacterium]|jgi:serine/threonine-protein kinase|nr:serine/threonine-protein kinase [Polyangiaceae bacterium]
MSHDTNQKGLGARVPTPNSSPASEPTDTSTGLKLVGIRASAESLPGAEPMPIGSYPMQSMSNALIGYTIDNRYKVEAILGEGGMGVVYRCRHKIIDKKVAMKVLRADLARDQEVTERFLTEAKAASTIGDEHIIDISDFGLLPDGSTYFVMEYLDGQPLSSVLHGNQPVPVQRLLHIAIQLSEGLAAAHDAGIVHRDLKPDNIFLITRGSDKDFVKILDFGIAKVSTGTAGQLTRAGSVFGTPHYMSPEQAAGAPVDHRGDVYSFGVILYELACGRVPFDADNFMGILTQHMYKSPVPIRALVPPPQEIPPGLEAIVLKCLSKRPEQRYQSMRELMSDLELLKNGLVPEAVQDMMTRSGGFNVPNDFFKLGTGRMPAPVPATPLRGDERRWPIFAGFAGVAVAVGLVVAIFAHSSPSPASSAPVVTPAETAPPVAVTPAPAEAITSLPVAIAVEPIDAEVMRDGASLGTSPVVVEIPQGKTMELIVTRPGYVTQRLILDGKQPKLMVRLEHERVAGGASHAHPVAVKPVATPATTPPAETPRPKPKPQPQVGGGEIVNPWAK